MGRLIISENITLDGVVQDPDGQEGFRLGGWFVSSGEADLEPWAAVEAAEAEQAQALLLGRRSDEWFGSRWNDRPGPWADRLNSLPKYVVSAALDAPRWVNSSVLRGDAVKEVAELKRQIDGDIVVYGSIRLARTLLTDGLVDELRLTVFPTVLGDGERLFAGTSMPASLRLAGSRPIGSSLLQLSYEAVPAS
jgi:dihydrofolate reductase